MLVLDAIIVRDGSEGYLARCPSMRLCKGSGATTEQALHNLKQSILKVLAGTFSMDESTISFRVREERSPAA